MDLANDPLLDIDYRRAIGIDGKDEEWDGRYVMTPSPSVEHQRIVFELTLFLGETVRSRGGGLVLFDVGVFRPGAEKPDYRIPDLIFVSEARRSLVHPQGLVGGPDVVVEVRSPGDTSDEKFSFYERVGVGEFWIIDREDKRLSLWQRQGDRLISVHSDRNGRRVSAALEVILRESDGRLEIVDQRQPARRLLL